MAFLYTQFVQKALIYRDILLYFFHEIVRPWVGNRAYKAEEVINIYGKKRRKNYQERRRELRS